jgi:hypothetical protein
VCAPNEHIVAAPGKKSGLLFGAKLAFRFVEAGISCFSRLHFPEVQVTAAADCNSGEAKRYFLALKSFLAQFRVVIVVQTAALYQSDFCLQELAHVANYTTTLNILLVKIMEDWEAVRQEQEWEKDKPDDVKWKHDDHLERRKKAQNALAKGSFYEEPNAINKLLDVVADHLSATRKDDQTWKVIPTAMFTNEHCVNKRVHGVGMWLK